jgi:hypothetical protein
MRCGLLIALIWLTTALGVLPGHAEKRVALVIGNSAYRNVPALPNPINDAADMGDPSSGSASRSVGSPMDRSTTCAAR